MPSARNPLSDSASAGSLRKRNPTAGSSSRSNSGSAASAGNLDDTLLTERETPDRIGKMTTRAGAFDLVSRFVQETTFLGPVEPQHGGCGSSRPAQMCSNGDVHEHRHVAEGTHVLKGERDSQARDAAGG